MIAFLSSRKFRFIAIGLATGLCVSFVAGKILYKKQSSTVAAAVAPSPANVQKSSATVLDISSQPVGAGSGSSNIQFIRKTAPSAKPNSIIAKSELSAPMLAAFSKNHGGFRIALSPDMNYSLQTGEDGKWQIIQASRPGMPGSFKILAVNSRIQEGDYGEVADEVFGLSTDEFETQDTKESSLPRVSGLKTVACFQRNENGRMISGCHVDAVDSGRSYVIAYDGDPGFFESHEEEIDAIYSSARVDR